MQAPKESLDAAIAANWATAQADPPAPAAANSVTGNSPTHADKYMTPEGTRHIAQKAAKAREDMFARGMREGTEPYIFAGPARVHHDSDVTSYRMGGVHVSVTGLEMLQATDPEALGYAKGQELKRLYRESAEAQPVPSGYFDGPPNPPGQDIGMGSKRDMPPLLQMTISTQFLSTVLHELAGQASMCWTMPPGHPNAVFDSQRACDAVAHALKRLAPEPSPNRVHVEPELVHYYRANQGQDNGA